MALKITRCPTCDSTRIRRVRKSVRRTWKERAYVVPNLEFEECPECGERLFDREAMRKIETYSPAFAKQRAADKKAAAR